jgi:hypothetical protein
MASGDYSCSAYRETIRHSSVGERKYIRYFDGRGHFGHVSLLLTLPPGAPCSVSVARRATRNLRALRSLLSPSPAADLLRGTPDGWHVSTTPFISGSVCHRSMHGFRGSLASRGPDDCGGLHRHLLLVDVETLSWTIRALAAVPGALRITQRSTELMQLRA